MSTSRLAINTQWINRLQSFKQIIIGFSGGLDSTVLAHLLSAHPCLKPRLLAVHVNHGISNNALHWQKHCEQWCQNLNISFMAQAVDFRRSANIEEQARKARFAVFNTLLDKDKCLLLGHHLDDQAETLLLQLFRGAGLDGLASMLECNHSLQGSIFRPLLPHSRAQLLAYAKAEDLSWIEDESNLDTAYSRNFLRHEVIPLLSSKWPGIKANLARTAQHCQAARINLDELALLDCQQLKKPSNTLSISSLKVLSEERIINVLRRWLRTNGLQLPATVIFKRLVHELLWASPDATPRVSWNEINIYRYQDHLYIESAMVEPTVQNYLWTQFPQPLVLAGGQQLLAKETDAGLYIAKNAKLTVTFRRGGEQIILHGQTKQLKKLLQQWQVPTWRRASIPLLYINQQLAAVIGYAISDLFYTDQGNAYTIYSDDL